MMQIQRAERQQLRLALSLRVSGSWVSKERGAGIESLVAVAPNDQDRLDVLRKQHFCLALNLLAQVFQPLLVGLVWDFLDRLPKPLGCR